MTGQEQNIYEGIHMPHNTNICSKQAKRFKCIRDGPELRQKKNFMENVLKFTSSKVTCEKSTNIPC